MVDQAPAAARKQPSLCLSTLTVLRKPEAILPRSNHNKILLLPLILIKTRLLFRFMNVIHISYRVEVLLSSGAGLKAMRARVALSTSKTVGATDAATDYRYQTVIAAGTSATHVPTTTTTTDGDVPFFWNDIADTAISSPRLRFCLDNALV